MSVSVLPSYSQLDLAIDPPHYTPRARNGIAVPLTPNTSIPEDVSMDGTESYVHTSKHMALNLGPKLWCTALPAYGFHGVVQGWVDINDRKGIRKALVVVSVLTWHLDLTVILTGI